MSYAQKPPASTIPSNSQSFQIRIAKAPLWQGNCLQVSIWLVNRSRFPVVLPHAPFDGIEAYASVNDPTNTLGQGAGEAWLLVYGWTDVIYRGEGSRVPRSGSQKTFCIEETFPVRSEGKSALRQVRLQGKLRVYVNYVQKRAAENTCKRRGEGVTTPSPAKVGNSGGLINDRVMLEIQVPCPTRATSRDCTASPLIFPGEHDFWWIEPPEPPSL